MIDLFQIVFSSRSRQPLPADGCKATKEGLIDGGLGEADDCPICRDDWHVLCRVSNHPHRQPTVPFEHRYSAKRRRLVYELINVDTFAKPVTNCENYFKLNSSHNFVDLDRPVKHCVGIVRFQLPRETSHDYRVPPLVLMRFACGGKTTTLARVFDSLKNECDGINPILLSFNGNSPNAFQCREGESQSQSILRLIALQLGDYSLEQARNLVVDHEALDRHLGDNNVVLLIDELNNLGVPLDADAAKLLREMFLDRAGRYLVFTSHVPVSIEANTMRPSHFLGQVQCGSMPASMRGVAMVDMPSASTLQELRAMSTACEGLTEENAAWLGFIPSLVYVVMNDAGITPSMRFRQMGIIINSGSQPDVLQRFVKELLGGQRDPEVARYYAAFASVDADSLVSYPLCYVKEIFAHLCICDPVVVMLRILKKLEYNLDGKQSDIAWECTVQIAIILRMLEAQWFGSRGPFGLVPFGTRPELAFRTLPDECKTLTNARHLMDNMIVAYTAPTLIYISSSSTNACYPEVEGFVAYTSGNTSSAKIVGFQMKPSDVKPRSSIDTTTINGGAVLIRGQSLTKEQCSGTTSGWQYMTSEQVRDFLGRSLLLAMPRAWLQDP